MNAPKRRRIRHDAAGQCRLHLRDLRKFEKRPDDVRADEPDLHRRIVPAMASSGMTSPGALCEAW